ncbi:MAG: RodZ domain-containing protein, partial [Pseudomonadota bacterium]
EMSTPESAVSDRTEPESAAQSSSFQENAGQVSAGQVSADQQSAVEESTALEDAALESAVPENTVPESSVTDSTAAGASEPTATEAPDNAASLNQNESDEPVREEPQAPDNEALAEDTADDGSAGAEPNTLELTFNQQSWTEIFDANNQRVLVGLQEPGTSASVEGEPPFRLTVGNATGVELRYQGDVVDLEERAGANNVARFTLGE